MSFLYGLCSLYATNERILNDIYFSTIAKGNFIFTEPQKATISNIAYQCPYTGGVAVYRARALQYALTDENSYDDVATCNAQNIAWRHSNVGKKDLVQLSLFPNPAEDKVSSLLNKTLESAISIAIYNTLGQKVAEIAIPANTLKVNFEVETWGAGIYYYQTLINQQFYEGKFIVE